MLYKNIINILNSQNISFEELEHEESKSCDDSKIFRQKA
jgi:hypothetical protein